MNNRNKIVFVGSTNTGKTSIIQRFSLDQFSLNSITTNQAAFFQKTIKIETNEMVLDIWDTAGQERFHSLTPMYYRDAKAAVIVFDITNANSFSKAKQWINELKLASNDQILLYLVGNKIDLIPIRVVSTEEASNYSRSFGIPYFETSAKIGNNLELLFLTIGKNILNKFFEIEKNPSLIINYQNEEITTYCC